MDENYWYYIEEGKVTRTYKYLQKNKTNFYFTFQQIQNSLIVPCYWINRQNLRPRPQHEQQHQQPKIH
jgi:hypothetical protein